MNQCRDFGGTVAFGRHFKFQTHLLPSSSNTQKTLHLGAERSHVRDWIDGIIDEACRTIIDQLLSIEALMKILVPWIGNEDRRNSVGDDLGD